MKLATKKIFHNVLAVAVSLCMICTMTPSLAWGSGVSSGTTEIYGSGETQVKGVVRNTDFDFDSMTPNGNYADKAAFVAAIQGSNALKATLKKNGVPDNYNVSWYIQEVEANADFDSSKAEGPDNQKVNRVSEAVQISSNDYTKDSTPTENGGVPTFAYPSSAGMLVQPNDLPMNGGKMYEFSIVAKDANGQEASAVTYITLLPDFPEQVIGAEGEGNEGYSVWGDIYQDFKIPPSVSVLEVTPLDPSDPNYQAVVEAAGDNPNGAEGIEGVTQIALINNGKPDDVNPYEGPLEVRLPVPEGLENPQEGDEVNVYIVDEDGNVNIETGIIGWAADPNSDPVGSPLLDEEGNKVPAVIVEIEGTGVVLGGFAVGIPADGSYFMTTSATEGGQISPAGKDISTAIGSATTFSTYAIAPHYKFDGFTLKVNGTAKELNKNDVGYNKVTIMPNAYGIKDDDHVELTANYVNATPGSTAKTVSARLINEGGASGSFTVSTLLVKGLKAATGKDVVLKGTKLDKRSVTSLAPLSSTSVDRDAGLLLEFLPNAGSYVKQVLVNGKEASFQGNSLMLGTVADNLTIQVIYASGPQPVVPTNEVQVKVATRPNGSYPATLPGSNGAVTFDTTYSVSAGGQVTIKATPYRDIYTLEHVYVYSPADATTPTDIIKHVYVSPNNATYNYPQDEIQLYNVAENTRIELSYKILPAYITVEATQGGSWGWIPGGGAVVEPDPNVSTPNQTSMKARARAKAPASTYAGVSRLVEQVQIGNLQLENEGDYARLVIRADQGYELGDVLINDTRINNLLTKRSDVTGDCYTVVVYLGAAGTAPSSVGDIDDPAGPDKIYYTNSNQVKVQMKFNTAVIEMPTYNLITTSVTEFGGGIITPSRSVEDGDTAVINFFPEQGYKVENVWLDDELLFEPEGEITLYEDSLIIENVRTDHSVRVSFTPGEPDGGYTPRYTVIANAGAGGSITPSGRIPVYEGSTEQFTLVPNTGYDISTVMIDGVEKTAEDGIFAEDSRNTIEIKDIRKDTNVAVTFKPLGTSTASTFTVTPAKEGQGRITPSSAVTVGAGADAVFTVIPDEGWYVQDIRATYGTGSSITEVSLFSLYDKNNFTFQFFDVRENSVVTAVFAKGTEDGKIPGTDEDLPTPPGDDQKVDLGDLEYNPDKENPGQNPGALLTPSLSELEIIKEPGTNHAAADQTFTVTVMDGYELDEPIATTGTTAIGGIVVKDGDGKVLDAVMGDSNADGKVVISQIGDGVYTVMVPKEQVTDGLSFELNTHPKTGSTENAQLFTVTLGVAGEGYISPGMTKVGDTPTPVQVEKGKNQSFCFIPEIGWKLYTVYLNGTPTTITNGYLTVPNIQQDTTIEAVFSRLEEGEEPPAKPTRYTIDIQPGNGIGVSPMGKVTVVEGSRLNISASPRAGYKVTATDNGTPIPVIGNSVTIGNIRANHTIVIDQEQIVTMKYHRLSVTSQGPGTTSPAGTTLVVDQQQQTITLVPDSGMKVKSVVVNSQDMTNKVDWSKMSLSLGAISGDTRVEVEYCDPDTLSPSDPANNQPPAGINPVYYDITTSAPDGGGMVSPASSKVASGGSVNLTIMPNNGYELDSIMVGSDNRTNFVKNNTLTVTGVSSNLMVQAYFKKADAFELDDFYTLFVNAEGDANGGGTVSPIGALTVPAGGSQIITIMPDPGYKVAYIEASHNGNVISRTDNFAGSAYTFFNVTQDMNIRVKFERGAGGVNVLTHDIVSTSTMNGRISPEGTIKAAHGQNATFTFVPNPGYKLSYVTVDGSHIPAQYIGNSQYIFTNVVEGHTLHAVFAPEDTDPDDFATISIGKTLNGIINPSDNILVKKGESRDLLITPFYGYKVKDVLVGVGDNATPTSIGQTSVELGTPISNSRWDYDNGRLTLKDVQSNTRVTAVFARDMMIVPDNDDTPTYIPVGATTTGKDGAGGETILGNGGYVFSPDFQHEPDPSELNPQITIAPNPGSTIEEVTLTYGDGSKVVTGEHGVYVYDKEGYLLNGPYDYNLDGTLSSGNGRPINSSGQVAALDEDGKPIDAIKYPSKGPGAEGYPTSTDTTARTIYEKGYVVMDGIKAVVTNGITCDVVFRPLTDDEKKEIEDRTLVPAKYVEFNISASGGGRVFPDGRMKVAEGQGVVVQFLPSNGYEVASVLVDGVNKIDEVMSNRTRNYIFQDDETYTNHTLEVTFGFVGNSIEHYDVRATSNAPDGVSPEHVSAPKGSDPVVYFFPPDGKKVDTVIVKKDGVEIPNAYTPGNYMYMVSGIDGNYDVDVTYVDAAEGDATWNVTPVRVTANCPNGNGSVSPSESIVPAGSPQTFFFDPAPGYMVDYVIFNGIATTLKDNPTSFAVTPSVGAENNMAVYFREATSRDKKFVTIVPQVAEGSNAVIEPKSVRAEIGGTTSFYVSPGAGQTLDTVTVDGWPVTFRPALPDGVQPTPNAEYTTYIVTIDDVHENCNVVVATKATNKTPISVQRHNMTIRGENVLYSPMGTVTLPEGGSQLITVNPLAGYYLDSVIVTDRDASGNVVNEIDMTENVRANQITVPMGAYNREVYIKYLAVGDTDKATPAYITIGNTKMEDGRDVTATIAMRRDNDGALVPITVDPETRMLMGDYVSADGKRQPLAFVRGGSYTFYASAEPIDPDTRIILSEATYNGNEQTVPNLTGMIANLKVNASGILDLVFRELKEGEDPVITQDYTVKFRVVDEDGNDVTGTQGTVRPSTALDGMTIQMGNSTGPIYLLPPEDGNWMVASVTEYLYSDTDWENEDSRIGAPIEVNPAKYKNETYNCWVTAPANILVEVRFVECALVYIKDWKDELGLIAPNAGKNKPLKLEASDVEEPYPFIIAPYEDCYIKDLSIGKDDGDKKHATNYNSQLEQTQAAYDFLVNSGYGIKKFDIGEGQVTPENMKKDDTPSGDEPSTMAAMAVSTQAESEWYGFRPIDYSVTIPDTSTTIQRPYSVLADLSPDETYVWPEFARLNDDQQFTITPRVNGTGGRIEPSTAQTVNQGGTQTFNFIANNGYTVKRVLIDGSPITGDQLGSNGTSYTFLNVDRNHTIEVEFGPITSDESSRLLRVASSLAQTGDLTGPAIGCLLIIAALGLAVTAISYIRRQRRRAMRRQGMR